MSPWLDHSAALSPAEVEGGLEAWSPRHNSQVCGASTSSTFVGRLLRLGLRPEDKAPAGSLPRQPYTTQLEFFLGLYLEYHPWVVTYQRGDMSVAFATAHRLAAPLGTPYSMTEFDGAAHIYLPDFVGTLGRTARRGVEVLRNGRRRWECSPCARRLSASRHDQRELIVSIRQELVLTKIFNAKSANYLCQKAQINLDFVLVQGLAARQYVSSTQTRAAVRNETTGCTGSRAAWRRCRPATRRCRLPRSGVASARFAIAAMTGSSAASTR